MSNIYSWSSNQMMMIKSNEGNGAVENVVFENFIDTLLINRFTDNLTTLLVPPKQQPAATTSLSPTSHFQEQAGPAQRDGTTRGPVRIAGPNTNPCTDITIDFAMWTEAGDTQWYLYESACGSRFRLNYTTTNTTTAPTGYSAAKMAADLKTALGTTASIPIPTIPTSFFPGATPEDPGLRM
ncbi:putative rhamnogalacturonase B [Talaromyces pinophilus]|nr:putative rhamnogalacturonase B [Talaromyces pinophilus]